MIHFTAWGIEFKIWPGEILGLAMIAGLVWFFWRAQRDPHNPIDLAGMFVWPGTKHTSIAFLLAFLAGTAGIWVILDREFRSTLSTEMFLGFLTIMVGGKGMTEWVNAWRSRPPPPPAPTPPPAQQQFVTTADSVNMPPPPIIAPVAVPVPAVPVAAAAATDVQPAARPRKRAKARRQKPKGKR